MDPLEAVGDPELRAALRFVRSRRSPVSADDLAAKQRVHRNVARARLERLARAGLLVSRFERRSGRTGPGGGRPAKVYSPAPETTGIEFPDRNYAEPVGLLVEALPSKGKKRRLRDVGIKLAGPLARRSRLSPVPDLRRGAERVCDAVEGVDAAEIVCETRDCLDDHASCRVVATLKRSRSSGTTSAQN